MGEQNEAESEDDPRESLDVGGTTGGRSRRKKQGQQHGAVA